MGIWLLPTANSLEVIAKVRDAMKDIQAELPGGMISGIPYDATENIQDAIREVLKTLTETLLIVVLVIFLFIGSVRGMIIGTAFTLFVVPAIYTVVARTHVRDEGLEPAADATLVPGEPATI